MSETLDVAIFAVTFIAFVIGARFRPALAIAGLILVDPFALYHHVGPTTVTLPKLALAATALGFIWRRTPLAILGDRRAYLVALAAIAVVAATAASIAQAAYPLEAVRQVFKAAEYLGIFLVALVGFSNDPDERLVVWTCIVAGAIVAVAALAQEAGAAPSAFWGAGHHAVARIAGPLEGPNQLAGYLGLVLPVAAAAAYRARAPWLWSAVGLLVVCDVLTFSRSGVATGFVAVAVALAVGGARWWHAAMAVVAPAILGGIIVIVSGGPLAHFWSTHSQLQPEGLGTRRQLWTAAYRLWRAHPLLGIGADNFEFELGRVGFPELHTHPNGAFVQALVEGGIPLFVAFLWATLQPIVALWSTRRLPLVAATIGACVGLALHQVVDSMTFFPKVGGMLWLLVGIGVATAWRGAAATTAAEHVA